MEVQTSQEFPALAKRCAGVLLHPTSLPCSESYWKKNSDNSEGAPLENASPTTLGKLGKDASRFIDFMADAGLQVWQMLPVVPTDKSPYQALSVHAGNPNLISIDDLIQRGWVTADQYVNSATEARRKWATSFYSFSENDEEVRSSFAHFCEENEYWLADFVLFTALRKHFNNIAWVKWPEPLRNREGAALDEYRNKLKSDIDAFLFEQFAFFTQWHALKDYAHSKNIKLFGDMPIFVGHNSADVWAQPQYFQLDENGSALTVAGVPPDSFSKTGQLWGNPHYAWDVMRADGFAWWLARLRTQLQLFDLIRIDHFRAFAEYWEVPGGSKDACDGKWVKAPGEELLTACFSAYPNAALIAENLGLITENVEQLRNKFRLPGMLVLQFAFDGKPDNTYLPANHKARNIVYTGTHDNNTTLGWYQDLNKEEKNIVKRYLPDCDENMPWALIEMAFASAAHVAIIPMQDFLELDGNHRMNMPGASEGNWGWQFDWQQLDQNLAAKIRQLLQQYERSAV